MGFWDWLKGLFGGGKPKPETNTDAPDAQDSLRNNQYPFGINKHVTLMLNSISLSSDMKTLYLIDNGVAHAFSLESPNGVVIGIINQQLTVASAATPIPVNAPKTVYKIRPNSQYTIIYSPQHKGGVIIGFDDVVMTLQSAGSIIGFDDVVMTLKDTGGIIGFDDVVMTLRSTGGIIGFDDVVMTLKKGGVIIGFDDVVMTLRSTGGVIGFDDVVMTRSKDGVIIGFDDVVMTLVGANSTSSFSGVLFDQSKVLRLKRNGDDLEAYEETIAATA